MQAMNTSVRLLGFFVLLAGVFTTAAFVGNEADLGKSVTDEPEHGGEGMEMGAVDEVRGLAVSDNGLTLELAAATAPRGTRTDLEFRIADARGRTVRKFDLEHTKRMHVIVVRRDLTGFQHVHPVQQANGSWSVPVTLDEPGNYRVFADFSTGETPQTLGADLTVAGPAAPRELPAPAERVEVDGLDVAVRAPEAKAGAEAELDFDVTRDGRPVEVEDYLGAKGHLVALREGDLAFLHVHPDEDRLRFMSEFPSAGSYRLFLQFKVAGRVHTAAFTQEVAR